MIGTTAEFLRHAAMRGERTVALARLLIAGLLLGQWVFLGGEWGPSESSLTYWTAAAGLGVAVAFSAWVLIGRGAAQPSRRTLLVSVTVDAAVLAVVIIPFSLWPTVTYEGFLRAPNPAVLLIGIILAGFRLSRRVALTGTVSMLGVAAVSLLIDFRHNAELITYRGEHLVNWLILFIAAAAMSYVAASRTRRLVFQGADAAVKAERARQRLGVYVSEQVAAEALAADELAPGGRRQSVAILFADLRGFTSYAEALSPENLIGELNEYLEAMVAIIRAEGGVVDKYMGDSIMAVFGIPRERAEAPADAVRAAQGMQRALEQHNAVRAGRGQAPLQHGIGVHFGPVVAGHVGTRKRLQYTVLGDVVNLASRLESATKSMGVPVLISAATVEAARGADEDDNLPGLKPLGATSVPGRRASVEVYTLAGLDEP
ncbi:MAG: adenylate/guanylate cyclase domain-containing protein [Deltaproteobacteria bacterium]|jgi:class 3 adenylate cyclase|nr:adenylate/guanylate cyclase domain-containing protein [Deltaproteobacteria bacterium]MBW2531319.1 adenylate/guanylate cyclase domain-containing protein [Deltaproteobacteria bacterium]